VVVRAAAVDPFTPLGEPGRRPVLDLIIENPWVVRSAFVLGGVVLGLATEWLLFRWLHVLAERTQSTWDDLAVRAFRRMPVVWWTAAGVWGAIVSQGATPEVRRVVTQALVVVLIASFTLVAARLASGSVDRYAAASGARVPSTTLVNNLVALLIGIIGLFLILQNLDIEITPLLTALGVGGLAVALALQDTLGNLFAGISVILSGQVRPADYVQLATGEEGFVTDVKARNTTIRTFPFQNLVVVPNSVLASTIVTNYSLPEKSLSITVPVGVSYDSDLERVEQVSIEVGSGVLTEIEGHPPTRVPQVRYRAFGSSSIDFDVILAAGAFTDQFLIRHEFIKALHRRFNDEGIEIPFPIRTVHLKQPEA
jgi:small-conductance mechanosensitive channel